MSDEAPPVIEEAPFVDVDDEGTISTIRSKEMMREVVEDVLVTKGLTGPTAGDFNPAVVETEEPWDAKSFVLPSPATASDAVLGVPRRVSIIGGTDYYEPLDQPEAMYALWRLSAYLKPLVKAMLDNVYVAPFEIKSSVDFDHIGTREQIGSAIEWGQALAETGGDPLRALDAPPTKNVGKRAVDNEIKRLRTRFSREQIWAAAQLESMVADRSYDMLRLITGLELEVTGNAYWEVLRDGSRSPRRVYWLPSRLMRATPQLPEWIAVNKMVNTGPGRWTEERQLRRFRRYIQLQNGLVATWYKEYGDPRIMSRNTGKYYKTLPELVAEEVPKGSRVAPEALVANEVKHIRGPGDEFYGHARWSGAYPALYGSRELDEENLKLVKDEVIPALMLLVAGGRISAGAAQRFKQQIEERKAGRKSLLVLEAWAQGKSPAAPTTQPKIDVVKMKAEQSSDALFQNYDKRNEEKALAAYRMPRALLGQDLGQNRATTLAMLRFAENQVFGPARDLLDAHVQELLVDAGLRVGRYRTKPMPPRDSELISSILTALVNAGVLTTNEARKHGGQTLDTELPAIEAAWASLPNSLLTKILQTKNADLAAALMSEDPTVMDKLAEAMQSMLFEEGGAPKPQQDSSDEDGDDEDTDEEDEDNNEGDK